MKQNLVVLIACSSKKDKQAIPIPAKNLYQGNLFKKSLEYAKSIGADKIFILSAKYGLVELDEKLAYYDLYLGNLSREKRRKWAENVLAKLKSKVDIKNDKLVILAGKTYYEDWINNISNYDLPLKNLGIGYQLKKLNELLNKNN